MNDEKRSTRTVVGRLLQIWILAGSCAVLWLYYTRPAPEPVNDAPVAEAEPASAPDAAPEPAPAPTPASALEEKWGIQVNSISLTNDATSVQVRYTVVAPDKTALLAGMDASAYLVDQATGQKLPAISQPPAGAAPTGARTRTFGRMMRQAGQFPPALSRLVTGKTYALQVPNWGRTLQPGSKVSLVVGNLRQDDLLVQ